MNKKSNSFVGKTVGFVGAGALSAVTASLCCITPVLALISGVSGDVTVLMAMMVGKFFTNKNV